MGWVFEEGGGGEAGAGGVEGAPVDGDGEARAQEGEGFGGAVGGEVAGAEGGSPAPDWEEGGVEVGAEIGHGGEEVGVACEVDRLLRADQEADGGDSGAE